MSAVQRLDCGCEGALIVEGVAQMHIVDGVEGTNVRCPEHGWTLVSRPPETYPQPAADSETAPGEPKQ